MTDLHDMAERIAEKRELEELRAEVKRLRRDLAAEKLRNLPPEFNANSEYAQGLRREAGLPEYYWQQYWGLFTYRSPAELNHQALFAPNPYQSRLD